MNTLTFINTFMSTERTAEDVPSTTVNKTAGQCEDSALVGISHGGGEFIKLVGSERSRYAVRIALINRTGEVLLVRHKNGLWLLPGGGIDVKDWVDLTNFGPDTLLSNPNTPTKDIESFFSKTHRATLIRELMEECGMHVDPNFPNATLSANIEWLHPNTKGYRNDVVYCCYVGSRKIEIKPSSEIMDFQWIEPNKVRQIVYYNANYSNEDQLNPDRYPQNTVNALLATALYIAGRLEKGSWFSIKEPRINGQSRYTKHRPFPRNWRDRLRRDNTYILGEILQLPLGHPIKRTPKIVQQTKARQLLLPKFDRLFTVNS